MKAILENARNHDVVLRRFEQQCIVNKGETEESLLVQCDLSNAYAEP